MGGAGPLTSVCPAGDLLIPFSVALEERLQNMSDEEQNKELETIGTQRSLGKIVTAGYQGLHVGLLLGSRSEHHLIQLAFSSLFDTLPAVLMVRRSCCYSIVDKRALTSFLQRCGRGQVRRIFINFHTALALIPAFNSPRRHKSTTSSRCHPVSWHWLLRVRAASLTRSLQH